MLPCTLRRALYSPLKVRILILTVVILLILLFLIYIADNNSTNHPIFSHRSSANTKLLTVATCFLDINGQNNADYRWMVQRNFLTMANFTFFRKHAYFVILTNSQAMTEYILSKYPHIAVYREPRLGPFFSPMLKESFKVTMRLFDTPFYMFTNGDILFDQTLINALNIVYDLLLSTTLRYKLLITGTRTNFRISDDAHLIDERQIPEWIMRGKLFITCSQDYFIVTKDTADWDTYPEYIVGRMGYDNVFLNYAFYNEVELIDATSYINALHQSRDEGDFYSRMFNIAEQNYTLAISEGNLYRGKTIYARYFIQHYKGLFSSPITVCDARIDRKVTNALGQQLFLLQDNFIQTDIYHPPPKAKSFKHRTLVIIVLAYNRPASLAILLRSLHNSYYYNDRVDLIVKLDVGLTGYYDSDCIKLLTEYTWVHGSFTVKRHYKHAGALKQWLEAWRPNIKTKEKFLILEDNVALSVHFYKALLDLYKNYYAQRGSINYNAGYSLYVPNLNGHKEFWVNRNPPRQPYIHNIIFSGYYPTKAFSPIPRHWHDFLIWMNRILSKTIKFDVTDLKRTKVYQLFNRGIYSDWYRHMPAVWFSYYIEVLHPELTIGYLTHPSGDLASPVYFECKLVRTKKVCQQNGWWTTQTDLLNPSYTPIFRF